MLKALAFLIVALFPQDAPKKIYFEGPKDAKEEDLQKAAKGMEARCSTYGYSGITAAIEKGGILLSCDSGFSNEMRARLRQLAALPGKALAIHESYALSPVEAEQFKPGGGAPKDAAWFPGINGAGNQVEPKDMNALFLKAPVVKPAEITGPKLHEYENQAGEKMKVTCWVLTDAAAARIEDLTKRQKTWGVVIDGLFLSWDFWPGGIAPEINLQPKGKTSRFFTHSKVVEAILANPLPFRLALR